MDVGEAEGVEPLMGDHTRHAQPTSSLVLAESSTTRALDPGLTRVSVDPMLGHPQTTPNRPRSDHREALMVVAEEALVSPEMRIPRLEKSVYVVYSSIIYATNRLLSYRPAAPPAQYLWCLCRHR